MACLAREPPVPPSGSATASGTWTYLKAGLWVLPSLVATVFWLTVTVPKMKMTAVVYQKNELRKVMQILVGLTAISLEWFQVILLGVIGFVILFERVVRSPRRER
jgi:type II secretory pathway component PulF